MGECKAKIFKNNIVVTRSPLVCIGGFGQSQCEYYTSCKIEAKQILKNKEKTENESDSDD